MNLNVIRKNVQQYYTKKVQMHGATARGVDWNSSESQSLRFEQLLKVCNPSQSFSINDYGCGFGALVGYLAAGKYTFHYSGFDLSPQMVAQARAIYGARGKHDFFTDEALLPVADYTVASGIFNVKLHTPDAEWEEYVLYTLGKISERSGKGFAINMLTKYSDKEYMRSDLYYGDPLLWFDCCKRNFSRYVALLHDYPLFEFTLLVKKS